MTEGRAGEAVPGVLARSQRRCAGLVGLILVLTVIGSLGGPRSGPVYLTPPVGLIGLVSLPIGYRFYLWKRDQAAGESTGPHAFSRATLQALSITAAAGLAGVAVFAMTGEVAALLGVAAHLLLSGAIWPSPERLESFLDG